MKLATLSLSPARDWGMCFHVDLFWVAQKVKQAAQYTKMSPNKRQEWFSISSPSSLPNTSQPGLGSESSLWILVGFNQWQVSLLAEKKTGQYPPPLAGPPLGSANWSSPFLTGIHSNYCLPLYRLGPHRALVPFDFTRNTSHPFPSGTLDSKVSLCMLSIKYPFV